MIMKDFAFRAGRAIGITALSSIMVLAGLFLVAQSRAYATTPSLVQLGTAGNYSVFGGAGVTNTGTTTLNADLGSNIPITISEFASPSVIGGQTHAGDAQATQAQSDLVAAYDSAAALTPTATFAGDQAGKTFLPGVYYAGAAIANSVTMTLNGQGDPNAVFVFQINGALNPAASSAMDLINGAQASNVFWEVDGAVTIGATASFSGNIMANGAITVGAGSSIDGRALAIGIGAVTLANNVITTPDIVSFTSPPTPTSALTSTTTDSVLATGIPGDAGAISYASNTGSVCSVNSTNGALFYLGVGTCTITATQAADVADSYTSTTANASFLVTAPPAYTVTFNGNGSTSGATAQETDNVPTPLTLNGFVRTGYVFSGWNTIAGGTGTAYADGASYPFGAAATLYAQWTASPAYTVTFNGNGSTSGATAQETDNVPTPLTLNGFVRTGYVFSGWNTIAGGTGTAYADGASYPFGAAATLYAQWTASPAYTVTFNGNGSTSGATAQETDNVPTPLTLNGFVRTGYVFSGWNTIAGGTGTAYADGASYPFGAAATLYAQWTASPAYTVTFNGNGSTSGATAQETDNVPTPLTLNGFVRTGYVFSGWNTIAGGTGTAYADGASYPFGAAATLYAQWTASPPSGGSTTFPPTINSISPVLGSVSGGTSVVITGTNFSGTGVVEFGAAPAVDVIVVNSTTITARSPANSAGSINVTVTTPGGTSSPVPADSFTYTNPAPVVLVTGSPSSATVSAGGGYSGQSAVTNGSGTVSYTETISADSDDVVVSSTGEISAATSLSPGAYSVSGNDRDSSGDTGSWAFVLTVTGTAPAATMRDYDLVGADGGVFVFGQPGTGYYGSLPGIGVHVNDIVGMVITGDKKGYYLVGSDGGVFAFGDATFDGSLPGIGIHVDDIVGISPTANGGGYFLVGKDGGIFAFGNAAFEGSLPGIGIHVTNIVSFATNATGQGYWVVGSSGHVYAFGNAPGLGSASGAVTSIAATPSGEGYWLTGPDGGVFAFGNAPFEGSLPGIGVKCTNIVSMVPTSDGNGYLLVGSDGGVFAFGNALFEGSLPGIGIHVTNIVGAVSAATGLSQ